MWVTLSYFYGLCTKYIMVYRYDTSPPCSFHGRYRYDASPPCSFCLQPVLLISWDKAPWSIQSWTRFLVTCWRSQSIHHSFCCACKVASLNISLLCASTAGVWCSAELEFIQSSSGCVIIAPKAPALKEMHHIPDNSLPLHSSPKELPEVQSDFQPELFCQVLAIHCPLNFGGQAIASRGKDV